MTNPKGVRKLATARRLINRNGDQFSLGLNLGAHENVNDLLNPFPNFFQYFL
jgi:hypothetical protein